MSFEKVAAWFLAVQHLNNQDKINHNQEELLANQEEFNSNISNIAAEIKKQFDILQESLVRKCARCGSFLKEGSSFCHICDKAAA